MTPVLWGRGSSTNVQKVIWAAQELGITYDHQIVGGPHGGTDTPEFGALNPNRKVPVWQDDTVTLWESQAILRYLARQHGQLYGTSDVDQARVDQWLDWSATVFWPPARLLFLDYYREGRNPVGLPETKEAFASIETSLRIADDLIGSGPYLIGAHFTVADIAFGIAVNRLLGMHYQVDVPQNVLNWFNHVTDRPAFTPTQADEPTKATS